MEGKFYQQQGFYHTLLVSLLIIAIDLIIDLRQDLFVPESGRIKILGSLAVLLSIGLIFRWKYVYEILRFLILFTLIVMISLSFIVGKQYLINYLIVIASLAFVTYMLFFSSLVKNYVKKK